MLFASGDRDIGPKGAPRSNWIVSRERAGTKPPPRELDGPAYRITKNEDGTERRTRLAPRTPR